ncbi:MAG: TrkH family potassium uptake protein [Planctomycetota bacterium]|jgi:trk system potassium uptake protein TrkH
MALIDMTAQGPARTRSWVPELRPHQLLVLGFAGCIAVGTVLLRLPASAAREALSWTDALFTATSAVCVTGLIVVDTGSDLSGFGQAVTLVLLQIGGLGIMTFSTLFLLAAGGRPSLAAMTATGEALGTSRMKDVRGMVVRVVKVTLAVEAAAIILLFVLFVARRGSDQTVGGCAWSALYHSVSAFCNAGFGLHSDSLERYQGAWDVNLVIVTLIIVGGIGFPVLRDLARFVRAPRKGGKRLSLSLHSKIVLLTTALLLVLGTVSFLATEWGNEASLASLPVHRRFLAAFFQSTTARTAGFSTLNIGALAPATLFFMVFLMFVGASPCSTGGGVKTTTLGILGVLAISKLRGREEPSAFGRSIPRQVVSRAVTVALLSLLLVVTFTWMLLVTEKSALADGRFSFMQVVFEAVSAFATVGLSTGITSSLGGASKLLLVALMFVGRLGPLTVVVSVARRERPDKVKYPAEQLMVG